MQKRVLVIEDDPDISNLLSLHLKENGYVVETYADGNLGLQRALATSFDLLILDIMLPGMSGTDICREVRAKNKDIAILILTVKSDLIDKVLGLELGADDYMTKPFDIQELMARVRALLRRVMVVAADDSSMVDVPLIRGALLIDRKRHKVFKDDVEVELTPKQFDLLVFMARSPGRAYTRGELLAYVWSYESSGYEHTVDTHINRLRSKIEQDPSNPTYIITVWGVGYRFAEEHELPRA